MNKSEYYALAHNLSRASNILLSNKPQLVFSMLTGDLEQTQNANDARWFYVLTHGSDLFLEQIYQIDGVNDAILLLPQ
jgi:hypothetical protein